MLECKVGEHFVLGVLLARFQERVRVYGVEKLILRDDCYRCTSCACCFYLSYVGIQLLKLWWERELVSGGVEYDLFLNRTFRKTSPRS